MLRIEVISSHPAISSSRDYPQAKISLGRHISNDLILSDPRVSKFAAAFERQSDGTYLFKSKDLNRHFSSEFEFELFDLKIKAYNLGLISDEITKEISLDLAQEASKASIYKWAAALFIIMCLDNFVFEARNQEWIRTITAFSTVFVGLGFASMIFSFLSRAIEGRYNFFAILLLFLKTLTLLAILTQDLYGLRWVMGSWIWYDGIYYLLFLALILYFIWEMGKLTFSHIKSWIRITVVVICGLSLFTPQAVKFLPTRENYRYLIKQIAPPLLPPFEPAPKTTDEVVKAIHEL